MLNISINFSPYTPDPPLLIDICCSFLSVSTGDIGGSDNLTTQSALCQKLVWKWEDKIFDEEYEYVI